MERSFHPKSYSGGPEAKIRTLVIEDLNIHGWHVEIMHGNARQYGIPDLYLMHAKHGQRWVELKNPKSYHYTYAQLSKFPVLEDHGLGIWVMTRPDHPLLFTPPNWRQFLKGDRIIGDHYEYKGRREGSTYGPEAKIQNDIIKRLECEGWHVEVMFGNVIQKGIPDLFACHPKYGSRWVEVKNPNKYSFTNAQRRKFPIFQEHRVGIWVLMGQDETYKLHSQANWHYFL